MDASPVQKRGILGGGGGGGGSDIISFPFLKKLC